MKKYHGKFTCKETENKIHNYLKYDYENVLENIFEMYGKMCKSCKAKNNKKKLGREDPHTHAYLMVCINRQFEFVADAQS